MNNLIKTAALIISISILVLVAACGGETEPNASPNDELMIEETVDEAIPTAQPMLEPTSVPPTETAETAEQKATRRYLTEVRSLAENASEAIDQLRTHLELAEVDSAVFEDGNWWAELAPLVIRLRAGRYSLGATEKDPAVPQRVHEKQDVLGLELERLNGKLDSLASDQNEPDWDELKQSMGIVQLMTTALLTDIADYSRLFGLELQD